MKIVFTAQALDELMWWIKNDHRTALKIVELVEATSRDPRSGVGRPERLHAKGIDLCSRRINQKDRLVYEIANDAISVIACRFHYDDR